MKFRKKPVVVEAVQYWPGESISSGVDLGTMHDPGPYIETLEGRMTVSPGDWIITGVKGERYPCKPDIFTATYEPADAAPSKDPRWEAMERVCEAALRCRETIAWYEKGPLSREQRAEALGATSKFHKAVEDLAALDRQATPSVEREGHPHA